MLRLASCLIGLAVPALAGLTVDQERFGRSLGGWEADEGRAADYEISGSQYRTYRPVVTSTPNGGIFVSVRIDHRRGWTASADTASLELNFNPDGSLESAQSTLAFQGQRITSELIRNSTKAGTAIAGTGLDSAVRITTDLVADLSSKLLREKIVEPGRVSFPAAIRHNFNLLFAAIRVEPVDDSTPSAAEQPGASDTGPKLEIRPFSPPKKDPVKVSPSRPRGGPAKEGQKP